MKWVGRRQSSNVEDRRGFSGGHLAVGGGLVGIIVVVLNLLMGGDPGQVLNQMQQSDQQAPYQATAEEDSLAAFVSVVLADNEDVWNSIFQQMGQQYQEPNLVMFTGSTQSGCGYASAATGPFYCPADEKVYIDLSFYKELRDRFGASGDFAMAYVVAHEVGHHVQNLLGTSAKVQQLQQQAGEKAGNRYSVALELQADFYAGVWAHYDQKMKNVLEPGDIDEALNAANAIGDDRLQKMSQGYVVPDAFTHGTSQQRMYWFKKGYDTGDPSKGNTFDEVL